MRKSLAAAFAAAAFVLATGTAVPGTALAKSDKAEKAQAQECKKLADPKARDECVKKAGKGAEKTDKAGKKAKKK